MVKLTEKQKAVELRKNGFSYSEIMNEVPVAKSTLSLWLREVGLAKAQKQHITQKRIDAALRGALKRKTMRIESTKKIKEDAAREVGKLNERVFWLAGAALYWAEGNKQKEHNVACPLKFCNSDPVMIKFYYNWLQKFCGIHKDNIKYELYIHVGCDSNGAENYWRSVLDLDQNVSMPVRFKKGNSKSYRKNKGKSYFGLVRITVKQSTNLSRRISGWIEELNKQFFHILNSEVV